MKVLKFDTIYPLEYYTELQRSNKDNIDKMDLKEYIHWIHEQKMLYGEEISKAFSNEGWEVLDFYNEDPIYIDKLNRVYNIKVSLWDLINKKKRIDFHHINLKELIGSFKNKKIRTKIFREVFIKRLIKAYSPDVIFLREPCSVNNEIFRGLKQNHFIVSLVGCNVQGLPNWRFDFSDLIFTLFPNYQSYFISNGINSKLFEYGTIKLPLNKIEKKYDTTFVGVLGTTVQLQKTELLELVAGRFDFKWWGVKGDLIDRFPNLKKSWQGNASGLKMFEIYQQTKIILNDYPSNAKGGASNVRIKEVLSTGSMLLTRYSKDLELLIESNSAAVFNNNQHCLEVIEHYLKNDTERETIAKNGFEYGEKFFNGAKLMKQYIAFIVEGIKEKTGSKTND